MQATNLAYYVKAFTSLRRDYKYGGAPHKPILLLSILKLIEDGLIYENKIYISPELVSQFKSYWNLLVHTPHTANFSLPFYHLINEKSGFWHLRKKTGLEIGLTTSNSVKSFRSLAEAVDYAYFDEVLFLLLTQPENRELLRQALIEKYFPEARALAVKSPKNYLTELEVQFLQEPPAVYLQRLQAIQNENEREEEVYLRGAVFKREIPRLYDNTCAITGLRVNTVETISMVDACHIIPFAESYDDSVQNGISLCPNMHRAFDRGLISVDENYRVLVSPRFTEADTTHSLRQFAGREIRLPGSEKFYPSQEKLEIHRRKFSFRNI